MIDAYLLPASHYFMSINLWGIPSGTHTIKLVVNEDRTIPESNYNNNSVSKSFTFIGSPDLGIVYVELDKQNNIYLVNEQIACEFVVGNYGSVASPATKGRTISAASHATLGLYFDVPSLQPGEAVLYEFYKTFPSTGVYYLGAWAPHPSIPQDKNSSNDKAYVTIQVKKPAYVLPPSYTEYYQYPGSYTNGSYIHNGWDFKAPEGTNIYAMTDGVVHSSGKTDQMGNFVWLQHDNRLTSTTLVSRYLHMYQTPAVSPGAKVSSGQRLGGVGKTGTSNGLGAADHLHFDANFYGTTTPTWTQVLDIHNLWPDMSFSHTTSSARSSLVSGSAIPEFEESVKKGEYFDTRIINMLGQDEFEAWWAKTPVHTVDILFDEYDITQEQVKEAMENDVWYQMMESAHIFSK